MEEVRKLPTNITLEEAPRLLVHQGITLVEMLQLVREVLGLLALLNGIFPGLDFACPVTDICDSEHRQHQGGTSGLGNTSGVSQPTTGTTTSRTDPSHTGTGQDHHYGRDVAVGAGGIGAAGLAGR